MKKILDKNYLMTIRYADKLNYLEGYFHRLRQHQNWLLLQSLPVVTWSDALATWSIKHIYISLHVMQIDASLEKGSANLLQYLSIVH